MNLGMPVEPGTHYYEDARASHDCITFSGLTSDGPGMPRWRVTRRSLGPTLL